MIAATNQNLASLVAAGGFRQDLPCRLSVFTVRVAPLREHMDDLPVLVDHFLGRMNREFGKRVYTVSPELMRLLAQHNWPGNARELQSTVKYAMVYAAGDMSDARLSARQPATGDSAGRDRPGGVRRGAAAYLGQSSGSRQAAWGSRGTRSRRSFPYSASRSKNR